MGVHHDEFRQGGIDPDLNLRGCGGCPGAQGGGNPIQQGPRGTRGRLQVHLSRLNAGEIEDVVNEGGQLPGA